MNNVFDEINICHLLVNFLLFYLYSSEMILLVDQQFYQKNLALKIISIQFNIKIKWRKEKNFCWLKLFVKNFRIIEK